MLFFLLFFMFQIMKFLSRVKLVPMMHGDRAKFIERLREHNASDLKKLFIILSVFTSEDILIPKL